VFPYFASGGGLDASFIGRAVNRPAQATRTGFLGVHFDLDSEEVVRSRNGIVYERQPANVGLAQNLNIYLLARNYGGSAQLFTTKRHSIWFVTKGGLTDQQIQDLHDVQTAYNNAFL
jgi:hypothetical protein